MTLAVLSWDRYFVIEKPLEAMRKATKKRALFQVLLVWIWAVFWSSPPFFGFGTYIPEGMQISCTFDYLTRDVYNIIFNMCMFYCAFCFPVMIIVYCYINIIRAVNAQANEMKKTAEALGAQTSADKKKRQQEITLAKVAATSVGLYIITWLPYGLISQLGILGMREYVNPYTSMLPVMFAKSSAMWNPILYALSHPRFRAVLEEKFPWVVCCKGRNMDKDVGKAVTTDGSEMSTQASQVSEYGNINNKNVSTITDPTKMSETPA